jgi:hypothetical protein
MYDSGELFERLADAEDLALVLTKNGERTLLDREEALEWLQGEFLAECKASIKSVQARFLGLE